MTSPDLFLSWVLGCLIWLIKRKQRISISISSLISLGSASEDNPTLKFLIKQLSLSWINHLCFPFKTPGLVLALTSYSKKSTPSPISNLSCSTFQTINLNSKLLGTLRKRLKICQVFRISISTYLKSTFTWADINFSFYFCANWEIYRIFQSTFLTILMKNPIISMNSLVFMRSLTT